MKSTTDIEAMRELLESMQGQIASLVAQNDALAKQVSDLSEDLRVQAAESDRVIASLKAELDEAKLKEASLVEEIKFWNMRFYGSKSEKVIPGQVSLFNEMEAAFDEEHPEPAIEDALPKRKGRPHRRGGKTNIDYDRFKTVVIEHDIPEGERACPECGCVLEEMNVFRQAPVSEISIRSFHSSSCSFFTIRHGMPGCRRQPAAAASARISEFLTR